MSNFKLRINNLIEEKKMSKSAFAKSLGKGPNGLDSVIVRGSVPNADLLTKIIEVYPEVNPVWLLTGQGEMFLPIEERSGLESRVKELEMYSRQLNRNYDQLYGLLEGYKKRLEKLENKLNT